MRTKNKIFRLTELQSEQMEAYLKKESTTFTDFIHSLIQHEVMKDVVTVKQDPHDQEEPPRIKTKTVLQVINRYQHTDPLLLLELSKIGNNLNQMARALNIIKNADTQEQRNLDIFGCFQVLKAMQTELENLSPSLPEINRQSPERIEKKLTSLQLVEVDESAY